MVDVLGQIARGSALGEQLARRPQRDALANLGVQQQQQALEQQQQAAVQQRQQFDQQQALRRAQIINQSARALKQIDPAQRASAFQRLGPRLQQFGIDPQQFAGAGFTDQELDEAIVSTQGIISDPSQLTAAQREFEQMTDGLSPEERERARRIGLGLEPRAGTITGQERIATTPGLTEAVATSEAIQEGAKEAAKLEEKLQLEPQIESAVKEAVQAVVTKGEVAKEDRSNQRALNLYQTGMGGLSRALGQTETGPFFGLLPAVTTSQQVADGAIAAMAPILKSMFRSSGEGTFTDKDQELLLNMIPTRKDTPAARVSKLQNIDAIVKAKLSQTETAPVQPSSFTSSGGIQFTVE